jgi:hypothetical protein
MAPGVNVIKLFCCSDLVWLTLASMPSLALYICLTTEVDSKQTVAQAAKACQGQTLYLICPER